MCKFLLVSNLCQLKLFLNIKMINNFLMHTFFLIGKVVLNLKTILMNILKIKNLYSFEI